MYPHHLDLRTGDVFLCHTAKSLEAKIIRKVLNSEWNHAAVVLVMKGMPYIVEARGGNELMPLPYGVWIATHPYSKVKHLPGSLDENRILANCGKKYDYAACLNLLFHRFTGKWIGARESRAAKSFYCFEYIAWLYQMPNWYMARPQEIESFLQLQAA